MAVKSRIKKKKKTEQNIFHNGEGERELLYLATAKIKSQVY